MTHLNRIYRAENMFTPERVDCFSACANSIIRSVHDQYFPGLPEEKFHEIYQSISVVARVISIRFGVELLNEMQQISRAYVQRVVGEGNWVLCPLFTLRYYYPNLYISERHEKAFLQTEPHLDNGFGNRGVSVWIPFHDCDDETGGLCEFPHSDVWSEFPKNAAKNRYNFEVYLERYQEIDPLLRQHMFQPHLAKGGALLHWDLIHGATKPRSKPRLSFNFRLIRDIELQNKENSIRRLHKLYGKSST